MLTTASLSLHFQISTENFWNLSGGYLADDGGFSNLNPELPQPRWDDYDPRWNEVGRNPDVSHRSYTAAWWNNQFTARALGISSSNFGDTYSGQRKSATSSYETQYLSWGLPAI